LTPTDQFIETSSARKRKKENTPTQKTPIQESTTPIQVVQPPGETQVIVNIQ